MRAYSLTTRRPKTYKGVIAYGELLRGKDYQDKKDSPGMSIAIVNGDKNKGSNNWKDVD